MNTKIGQLLLQNNMITEKQLAEALEYQKKNNSNTVGQILCRFGYISNSTLAQLLDNNDKRKKLSEILLEQSVITQKKVEIIELYMKEHSVDFKLSATMLKILDEKQIAKAIGIQYDIPFVDIDTLSIEKDTLELINPLFLKKHLFIPILKLSKTLTIAVSKPLKYNDIKYLENIINTQLLIVIAETGKIKKIIQSIDNKPYKQSGNNYNPNLKDLIADAKKSKAESIIIEINGDSPILYYRADGRYEFKKYL